jgi:hypothetical protein
VGWDGAKIKLVLCREEKRLVLPLLVILVVAALANAIRHELDVKPSLLASQTSLHLLCSKCFVERSLDRSVFSR